MKAPLNQVAKAAAWEWVNDPHGDDNWQRSTMRLLLEEIERLENELGNDRQTHQRYGQLGRN